MRHGSSGGRRQRGGNRGNNGGSRRSGGNKGRTQVFDSNGPDVRIRGTAHQINEKYMNLAKDANSSGDYVMAQSYLQHAEHYQRVINSWEKDAIPADAQAEKAQKAQGNQQQQKDEKPKRAHNKSPRKQESKPDDLALPASILGGSVDVKAEEKQPENA